MNNDNGNITVVLDDDPTGTQTVHDINVLTVWDYRSLVNQFESGEVAFYILTNSRALPTDAAYDLITTICQNLKSAAATTKRSFNLILRSDSTLRGHFPTEADAVESSLGSYSRWLICPYFEDGGRLTINDVHYIKEGDKLIPAAESPFAKDASFGYVNSNLKKWVEEKTNGRIKEQEVGSLKQDGILKEGVLYVTRELRSPTKVWITNITSMNELDIVTSACRKLEHDGMTILYRTAASFVQSYLGIKKKALLSTREMTDPVPSNGTRAGGVIIVGSYVPKTTDQLTNLLKHKGIYALELDIETLVYRHKNLLIQTISQINSRLTNGETVVIYTSRQLITDKDSVKSLAIGNKISDALVEIVRGISVRPSFFIAKGGITSSDMASKGLGVARAKIIGQALPGVPVWLLGDESRFPGLPYVVFPGNVGGPEALEQLVSQLQSD